MSEVFVDKVLIAVTVTATLTGWKTECDASHLSWKYDRAVLGRDEELAAWVSRRPGCGPYTWRAALPFTGGPWGRGSQTGEDPDPQGARDAACAWLREQVAVPAVEEVDDGK